MTDQSSLTPGLIKKLAAVMASVGRVPKNGTNKFHGYKYATEADLADAVRDEMATQGVIMFPDVEETTWGTVERKGGGSERLCTLKVRFTITDGEGALSFRVLGEGVDPSDKATYKALTGAQKYALLKLYLIATGDDPEREHDEEPARGVRWDGSAQPKPTNAQAVKSKVAAAVNGNAHGKAPATPDLRKADLKGRLVSLGVKTPADIAAQLGEWFGRPVDGQTSVTVDDWMKADAGIEQMKASAETLARARGNMEAAGLGEGA